MRTARFSSFREAWLIGDVEGVIGPEGDLLLSREQLSQVRAADLRSGLAAERDFYGAREGNAHVADVPQEYLDDDAPRAPIWFHLDQDDLSVYVDVFTRWPGDGDENSAIDTIRKLIEPLLRDRKFDLISAEIDEWRTSNIDLGITLRIAPLFPRGKFLVSLFDVAIDIARLCEAFDGTEVGRATVGDLVRGGASHLLIGQPEGNWLDVKLLEYDLASQRGKISLGQAVARFCNAEEGGIIVIGAEGRKVPGGEIIKAVRGVITSDGAPARYLRVLNQVLYPPPFGLRVDVVPLPQNRSLIVVEIPAQPEELKPFLVHGAIRADGKTEGAFISIVQRRGEESIPITAPMIHATLVAGRALLRGERNL